MNSSRYYKRSRISSDSFIQLLKCFGDDLSASEVARLTGLTRKTVTTIFLKLRQRIANNSELNDGLGNLLNGESFSARKCVCGRCRPPSSASTPLFGVVGTNERLSNIVFPDCRKPLLRTLIRQGGPGSGTEVDGWHGYDALITANNPSPLLLTNEKRERDAIVDFWNFTRGRLSKFNGVSNRTFHLHLKESEWRFNLNNQNAFDELIKMLEESPI